MLPEAARQIKARSRSPLLRRSRCPRGAANLEQFFGNFSTMMENMREGMQSMTSALLELVGVRFRVPAAPGCRVLGYDDPLQRVACGVRGLGRFFEWVDAAIVNFKALMWASLGSLGHPERAFYGGFGCWRGDAH